MRVLIADDHAVMREGLEALLAGAGIEVAGTARDGREAVLAASRLRPDVVIMDLSMPGMNGIEATREIRARSPAAQVVVLSMHADRQHVHHAFDAGALGYVLKESAGTEVVAAVRSAANGRRFVSPAIGEPGLAVAPSDPLASLSARERQVLQLVVEGKSSASIAQIVHLSPKSVETYRSRLMKKLGVADFAALVKFAVRHGITPPG